MSGKSIASAAAILLLASCAPPIQAPAPLPEPQQVTPQQWAASCEPWDEWDKPAPPYRIAGSTYYVGTCGISAILVAGSAGHILIDSGTEAGAEIVMDNVRKLGFRLNEIATILHSHEHFDHVGGHAAIKQASGAHVAASAQAALVLRSGVVGSGDPQAGMHEPMTPVAVDVLVEDGGLVRTETATLIATATPGHSPGALSWQWQECGDDGGDDGEGATCRTIVYADSLSPISSETYRFSDHPSYLADYRAGLARLRVLDCDILLTPHPSASKMVERAATGSLAGGMSCAEYADTIEARLDTRLAEEAAGG